MYLFISKMSETKNENETYSKNVISERGGYTVPFVVPPV